MASVRSRLLATSALITAFGLAVAGPALAQTAPAPQTDDGATEVEEIVVTGFRGSLERALDIKRKSTAAVDSIVAEDIAKFPDNNLAESLQRIPGVSITRSGGEGSQISVRGLGPDFTRVRINGIEAQATTGSNRGRGFDFNVFASELFSQLDVRKTPSANVEEGSLGATVDLHTARPFSVNGFAAAMSAQAGYNDLSEATNPRFAGLISNRWNTPWGEFGASASIAYSEKTTLQNGASTGLWNQGSSLVTNPNTGVTTLTPTDGGFCDVVARPTLCAGTNIPAYNTAQLITTRYPRFLRYQDYRLETKRTGITATLQWRPADSTLVTFDALYSKFEGERNERQLEAIGLSRAASQGGKPETVVRDIFVDGNGTALYMALDNVDIRSENYIDVYDTTFQQYTLNVTHEFNSQFSISLLGGYVKNDFNNALDYIAQMDRQNSDGYSYDMRESGMDFPSINYGFDVLNPANWYIGPTTTAPGGTGASGPDIRLRPNWNDNVYKTLQLDGAFILTPEVSFLFGVQAKEYEFVGTGQRLASETNIPALPAGTTVADVTEKYCGFAGLKLPTGTPNCWLTPNLDKIASTYNIFSNTGRWLLSDTVASARGDNRTVTEKDLGAYVQATFDFRDRGAPIRGDIGLRYVKTSQESGFYATQGAGFAWTTAGKDYQDMLPSLNVVYEPVDNLLIRFGAAKVMARAGLGSISAATNVSVAGGSRTVSSGNPQLEPYRATTYDLAAEWYPARGAIVSAAVFYKDISTYIQTVTDSMPYSATGLPLSLLVGTDVNADATFQVSSVRNTPGGPLKGFELNYQQQLTFLPGKLANFGILANYTYVQADIQYFLNAAGTLTTTQPLLNLSKHNWNGTIYYEDGPFSARVSANKRDPYLTAVPSSYGVDVSGVKEATYIDATMSYRVGKMTFSVEGINLTNEVNVSYSDSSAERLSDYFQSGRQFYAGLRYAF
jgi:iron complex outermembrane receptor protein